MADRLGSFELLLLLAVLRLGGDDETYGVPIRADIERRTRRVVSPGAIYTALDRLERRGLVRSRLGDPTPRRGGKRKRYYQLTPTGAAAVRRTQADLTRMARGLQPKLEAPRVRVDRRVVGASSARAAAPGDRRTSSRRR